MIDSHCHIAGQEFAGDLDAVIARARAAGLEGALTILAADDDAELDRARDVQRLWPEVRFSIGVHPHAAGKFAEEPSAAAAAVDAAIDAQPAARAVGEIGLDYHYDFAPREAQHAVFRAQIALALRRRLPIVIHTREAEDDTFRILEEQGAGAVPVVFHCFTGTPETARRVLDAGYYLSLAGIVTFPRALELKQVAAFVPLDRLLLETDSPYLAPVPHRGKRNEPAHVAVVADTVAALRGEAPERIRLATTATFRRIFNP
ncbi:MAG TPA: TatD family hydrolase [Vicinamibacterales bacterium]|nr:TatD family hydrolase [Vicinamibacterales bacterium]HXR44681.1 TatD family hydrolase [Pseudolysinimonas sp.]